MTSHRGPARPPAPPYRKAPRMKSLTVRQPWAHLIVAGLKRIENRSRTTAHRGPLLIHAGKTPDPPDADTIAEMAAAGITIPVQLDYGAIVGIVTVTDCVLYDDAADLDAYNPATTYSPSAVTRNRSRGTFSLPRSDLTAAGIFIFFSRFSHGTA
jgi:hypothetical protein